MKEPLGIVQSKTHWEIYHMGLDARKPVLTLYLKEMPFNAFANRADPDQAALVRAA